MLYISEIKIKHNVNRSLLWFAVAYGIPADLSTDSFIGEIMIKVTQKGINRLDIEMSGKLNSEEMKIALDELASKSKNMKMAKCCMTLLTFTCHH